MNLSHLQQALGYGRSSHSNVPKGGNHLLQVVATVKSETKFSEVTCKMLFANRMKSTTQGGFYITNDRIYPLELYHFYTLRASAGYYWDMLMTAFLKSTETFKAIGDHIPAWSQMLSAPSIDTFLRKCFYLAKIEWQEGDLCDLWQLRQ